MSCFIQVSKFYLFINILEGMVIIVFRNVVTTIYFIGNGIFPHVLSDVYLYNSSALNTTI